MQGKKLLFTVKIMLLTSTTPIYCALQKQSSIFQVLPEDMLVEILPYVLYTTSPLTTLQTYEQLKLVSKKMNYIMQNLSSIK